MMTIAHLMVWCAKPEFAVHYECYNRSLV